jgi:hypothetical protein
MASEPQRLVITHGGPEADRRLASRFVELVRLLPQVRLVLFDTLGYAARIWIILDAEPGNQAVRNRVYAAQLAASDAVPDALVGFRLVNLAEYEGRSPETLIPCDMETLWQRPGSA